MADSTTQPLGTAIPPREREFVDSTAPATGVQEVHGTHPRTKTGYKFSDIRLNIGDHLQVTPPEHLMLERCTVRLIGYVEDLSLLVTAPTIRGTKVPVLDGDLMLFRTYTSKDAFSFACQVIRRCNVPYDYFHLTFPDRIAGAMIRNTIRVRTTVRAQAFCPDDATCVAHDTSLENISATGALICSDYSLGQPGGHLMLRFKLCVHGVDVPLHVQAEIVNLTHHEYDSDGNRRTIFAHGVKFQELSPTDIMAIKSHVYQLGYEQPTLVM